MDFLRSSANENSFRERKTSSYGSLDRSWARRARSGSNSKKRPDLLNIDFSLERERPVSPANLDVANRGVAHEDARPRYLFQWFHASGAFRKPPLIFLVLFVKVLVLHAKNVQ